MMARDILAKATARFAGKGDKTSHRTFELVNANRADIPVGTMYRALNVSSSGYRAWRG